MMESFIPSKQTVVPWNIWLPGRLTHTHVLGRMVVGRHLSSLTADQMSSNIGMPRAQKRGLWRLRVGFRFRSCFFFQIMGCGVHQKNGSYKIQAFWVAPIGSSSMDRGWDSSILIRYIHSQHGTSRSKKGSPATDWDAVTNRTVHKILPRDHPPPQEKEEGTNERRRKTTTTTTTKTTTTTTTNNTTYTSASSTQSSFKIGHGKTNLSQPGHMENWESSYCCTRVAPNHSGE